MRILITGGSGFLGSTLSYIAGKTHEVYSCFYQNAINIPGVQMIQLNLLDIKMLRETLLRVQPEVLIHTAAESNPNTCQKDNASTFKINVDAPKELMLLCRELNIKLVFTSTDLVFDGKFAPYTVHHKPRPISNYGIQKNLAEIMVLSVPRNVVVRLPLLVGNTFFSKKSFFYQMKTNFLQGKKVMLFIDEYRTPIDTEQASKVLLWLAQNGKGLFHLAGGERISRYQMGVKLVERLNLDKQLIIAVKQIQVQSLAPRPMDVSLTDNFLWSCGFKAPSFEAQMDIALKEELV